MLVVSPTPQSQSLGPGTYSTNERDTISGRTSPPGQDALLSSSMRPVTNSSSSPVRSNGAFNDNNKLNISVSSQPTSSFGTSSRTQTANGDTIKGGVLFSAAKKEAYSSLGPGSYQDAHYRGSPDVVASLMLKKSHNIRTTNNNAKQNYNGTNSFSPSNSPSNRMSSPTTQSSYLRRSPTNSSGRASPPNITASLASPSNTHGQGNQCFDRQYSPSSSGSNTPIISRPHSRDITSFKVRELQKAV